MNSKTKSVDEALEELDYREAALKDYEKAKLDRMDLIEAKLSKEILEPEKIA